MSKLNEHLHGIYKERNMAKKQIRVDSPSPEFHKQVKAKVAKEGTSIAKVVITFLTNYIK